jgi:hypothetical protein
MSGSAIVAWSGGCSEEVEQPQGSGVEIQYCALRVARSLTLDSFTVPAEIASATTWHA